MGLFDYVHCKYPLPVEGANALEFQSKDTDAQYMEHYEIREDGTLWHEEYDTVDRSDPNAPKGSLESICGMASRENKRWVPCADFTGEVCFYTSWREHNDPEYTAGWIEFSAYFKSGALKELNILNNTPPEPRVSA